VLATFREVETDKRSDQPQLAAALLRCRQTRATLLVAKLDGLNRNAGFLFALRDAGTRVVAADMPDMNETVVGIMAVDAQDEARRVSERTTAALAAAKARGALLGNPPACGPARGAQRLTRPQRRPRIADARAFELRTASGSRLPAGGSGQPASRLGWLRASKE
jgi:DNA invertase Pin-like site-specific DNA recombinase